MGQGKEFTSPMADVALCSSKQLVHPGARHTSSFSALGSAEPSQNWSPYHAEGTIFSSLNPVLAWLSQGSPMAGKMRADIQDCGPTKNLSVTLLVAIPQRRQNQGSDRSERMGWYHSDTVRMTSGTRTTF